MWSWYAAVRAELPLSDTISLVLLLHAARHITHARHAEGHILNLIPFVFFARYDLWRITRSSSSSVFLCTLANPTHKSNRCLFHRTMKAHTKIRDPRSLPRFAALLWLMVGVTAVFLYSTPRSIMTDCGEPRLSAVIASYRGNCWTTIQSRCTATTSPLTIKNFTRVVIEGQRIIVV